MPPCGAPFLTAKVVAHGMEKEQQQRTADPIGQLPWRPISNRISIPPDPPTMENKSRRDHLASSAHVRYDEWGKSQPQSTTSAEDVAAAKASHYFPVFRERVKHKELYGEWSSADRVLPEHERIERAMEAATAAFLQNPPYPKQGGGIKNVEFSYMSSGYDYRTRQPSKEVSGTWPIMRTKAKTESMRINEAVAKQRTADTLGGGRWTIDQRYGNPPTFTPLPSGDAFRQSMPRKWMKHQSPPPSAPIRTHKWRGGFVTNFPPRTATAEPLDGATPWLHHTAPFEDRYHDTVAIHIPEAIKHGVHGNKIPSPTFRPTREKGKELTGGDGATQFWPQHTGDHFLPNPSQTCTWNVLQPPSPIPPRGYPKTQYGSPRGVGDADGLVSASQVEASGATKSSD